MNSKKHVVRIFREKGLVPIPDAWSGVDVLLPLINLAVEDGAVIVLKFDGGRTLDEGRHSAIISYDGARGPVRLDAESIEEVVAHVISVFARDVWGIPMEH